MLCPNCGTSIGFQRKYTICGYKLEKFKYIDDIKYPGFYSKLCFILGLCSMLLFIFSIIYYTTQNLGPEDALIQIYVGFLSNLLGVIFGILSLLLKVQAKKNGERNNFLLFGIGLSFISVIFNGLVFYIIPMTFIRL